ncbi:MAG: CBS domain-containing protein [archaeon]|nr:CBS domain-containing protein [archaeon]
MAINDLEDLEKLTVLKAQMNSFSAKDISKGQYPTVSGDDTVSDCIAAMRKSGFQEIPVVDGKGYVGMVKYSTLLRKKSATPETKVKAVLSNLPPINPDYSITEIAEVMVKENCRQLALLDGKKIADVVTRNNLVGIAAKMKPLEDFKVWEIMTSPVVTVKENEMLAEAIDTMVALDIRTLPVIDRLGNLSGVIGMNEVIENSWKAGERSIEQLKKNPSSQIPVSTIAVTSVVTVQWDDSIADVAKVMADKGISTLPVMDGDEIVGVVTEFDIVELIANCGEREGLFVQISGLSEDDRIYSDAMYADIQSEMQKITKIVKPESLTIHVARYNESGDRKKYSLTGRLFYNGRTLNCKQIGWDVVQANKELLKKFGESIKDDKDKITSFRRRK